MASFMHNHPPSLHPSSHPIHRRTGMTDEVIQAINTDAETGTKAAQTLARLNASNPDSLIRPRDIYNQHQRAQRERQGDMTNVEFLLSKLSLTDYHVRHKTDLRDHLSHLFFASTDALSIYADNPDVLLLDCTYKTNVFQMPLLNVVGMSGMNTTIHVGQAFMRSEAADDYTWAVGVLRDLIRDRAIALPQVILVDRDLALLNALEAAFPDTPVLLCIWHIVRDVESHARKHGFPQVRDLENSTERSPKWKDSDAHRGFCDTFLAAVRSSTEAEFEANRQRLHELHSEEAQYIDEVWFDIWKRCIVRAWTDNVVHFGAQTTSRVEGYHSALKGWLCASNGDLQAVVQRMEHWWRQSIHKHQGEVSDAKIKLPRSLRGRLFERVVRVIHQYALLQCLDQLQIVQTRPCTGIYTRTTGLPCYRKLRRLRETNGSLECGDFHPHWWIDRSMAPEVLPPRILEPATIAEIRAERRQGSRRAHGTGRRGTR